MMMMIIISN